MLNLLASALRRPINWRWQKATLLREQQRGTSRRLDDQWISMARRYQIEYERCNTDWDYLYLAEKYPAISEAVEIWREEGARCLRWELEARLLAKEETSENICNRLGMTPGGVAAYEALFFNVRDRLDNNGWIVHNVFGRSMHAGLSEREYDLLWKLFGFFNGPRMLDAIIDTFIAPTRPETADKVSTTVGDDIRTATARKALIAIRTMPVNSFTAQGILELDQKYREVEQMVSGSGNAGAKMLIEGIGDVMKSMAWAVGSGTRDRPVMKSMGGVDVMAAEPRASEMFALAAGLDSSIDDEAVGLTFPEATTNGADR